MIRRGTGRRGRMGTGVGAGGGGGLVKSTCVTSGPTNSG